MKNPILTTLTFITLIFAFSSCATIFSGTTQAVSFDSNPPGAEVVTIRKNGDEQKIGLRRRASVHATVTCTNKIREIYDLLFSFSEEQLNLVKKEGARN